mmetsp:Transcript_32432/g.64661  ORF Transcript_32432/g.64661 Transcript_32432/m.64661 type:complete len:226 (-) Transcript_32432:194-871(-)
MHATTSLCPLRRKTRRRSSAQCGIYRGGDGTCAPEPISLSLPSGISHLQDRVPLHGISRKRARQSPQILRRRRHRSASWERSLPRLRVPSTTYLFKARAPSGTASHTTLAVSISCALRRTTRVACAAVGFGQMGPLLSRQRAVAVPRTSTASSRTPSALASASVVASKWWATSCMTASSRMVSCSGLRGGRLAGKSEVHVQVTRRGCCWPTSCVMYTPYVTREDL